MPTIWLLRHGKAGDLMGDYDRLSELGHAQARCAGEAFRHLAPLRRLMSGEMIRQRKTALTFAEAFGETPPLEVDGRWDEFDHKSVIRAALAGGLQPPQKPDRTAFSSFFGDAMSRWASGEHDSDYSEPYLGFQGRVSSALHELADSLGSGDTALVATSGGVISAVCRELLGLEPMAAFQLNTVLVNGAMTRILVGRGRLSLSALNIDTHLARDAGLHTFA